MFHEMHPKPLGQLSTPDPTSNSTTLDAKVSERFKLPLWERGYLIKGRISINGGRKRVFVNGRIFRQSAREGAIPHHNAYQYGLAWCRARFGRRIVLDQAIWFNHPFETVYFHTINDLMTQLALAERLDISKNIPVIVDHEWASLPHARAFLSGDLLNDRNVIILNKEDTIVCRSLYMLQPQHFSRPLLDRVAASITEEKPPQTFCDRIVLVREKATTSERNCAGMGALIDALKDQGYAVLDPATLTVPQQKWVFSRARHIVSENGSSLTNIIFRAGKPLRVDALMASTFPSVTFQSLSKIYGCHYHAHVLPSTQTGERTHSTLTAEVQDQILMQARKLQED